MVLDYSRTKKGKKDPDIHKTTKKLEEFKHIEMYGVDRSDRYRRLKDHGQLEEPEKKESERYKWKKNHES